MIKPTKLIGPFLSIPRKASNDGSLELEPTAFGCIHMQNLSELESNCKFICHYRCRILIRLDCSGPRYQDSDQNECNEQTVEKDTNVLGLHINASPEGSSAKRARAER
uniref:Uncharacterized protein n=1 Tax=Sphaerodactylus townsendi TaxID=933632 RepID=A0ACB8EHY1_9SAUR